MKTFILFLKGMWCLVELTLVVCFWQLGKYLSKRALNRQGGDGRIK